MGLSSKAMAVAVLIALSACERETVQPLPPNANAPPKSISELMEQLTDYQVPAQGSRAKALIDAATAPTAESPEIDNAPPEGRLEHIQQENVDFAALLPPVNAEAPGVWNGWYVENTFDAFSNAATQNKPMVLVISESWCEHCVRLVQDSLRCPAIDRFAGGAVFALGSPSRDRVVSAIASSLKIESYPTVVVLEPEVRMLLERGRINGYFPSSTLGEHLETILWKTKPEDYINEHGVAEPLPPQKPFAGQSALTYWTSPPDSAQSIAAARSGAAQHGLKHAAPAPKCE